MELHTLKPRKALNKAFLKVKPKRSEIENFKTHLIQLLDRTNDVESEEFHKNLVIDFLKKTWYDPNHYINTKGRTDLVIHNGNSAKSPVGVIIETKKPTSKAEMLKSLTPGDTPEQRVAKINVKAFHELVLYYLRERITQQNVEIKYLIATNIYEWFIFDASVFERNFAQNKSLVKQFNDFESGRLADTKTDFFYKQVAEPFISQLKHDIEFTYFDIRDYEKPLRNNDPKDDNTLIVLYKLLSPEHLLKLPFLNDSNSLDKRFYGELLHIIGLSEKKLGSKKVIGRNSEGERHAGTLLENAINQLDAHDKISRLQKPAAFGETYPERLFNVGLELIITWINRILFLKLLEAQLVKYHKGDKSYEFLSIKRIKDFDGLDNLFFQVLARKHESRMEEAKALYQEIPYLNSSLFEPTEIEQITIFISNLRDDRTIPIYPATVLKDGKGRKHTGELSTLEYLFKFLDAYDFSGDGSEEIQEDNKNLINASVLGLIFEKINGYKDGSFFTPGFITMYMSRETIRRAVVQKFNETWNWKCKDFNELKEDLIEEIKSGKDSREATRKEANRIINSLRICDPAVGSGHFLVSSLNELITVKSELKVLIDRSGQPLNAYTIEVANDELIISDENNYFFEYHPLNKESQRVQETLFHEKQTIIENCLFGVDINPNSVKICRLRLWIELLKNAYYKNETELETLPNIDINIKQGNSLISRFALDADLKQALKKSKWSIDSYRVAVDTYRNAQSKEQKREMKNLVEKIKQNFKTEIGRDSKEQKQLDKLNEDFFQKFTTPKLFEEELTAKQKKAREKERKELDDSINKQVEKINDIKNNKIYENAFEWRFEFPEVLDNNGNFIGFDVVIGNPPYILVQSFGDKNIFNFYSKNYQTAKYKIDTYALFYELGVKLLSENSSLCYISPNTFLKNKHSKELRSLLLSYSIQEIINFYTQVFEDASVDTLILLLSKTKSEINPDHTFSFYPFRNNAQSFSGIEKMIHFQNDFKKGNYEIELDINSDVRKLLTKIESQSKPFREYGRSYFGIQTFDRKQFVSKERLSDDYLPVIDGGNIKRYYCEPNTEFVQFVKEAIKSGGDSSVYNKYRIVVRQIGMYPEGTIVHPNLLTLNTIYNIFLHEKDNDFLRFILSLVNSKMFHFYWLKKYYDNKATFPKIKKEPLESMPIKEPSQFELDKMSQLVESVMTTKEGAGDTSDIESQIDQMVYQLYGLTEEEIAIVEAGVK